MRICRIQLSVPTALFLRADVPFHMHISSRLDNTFNLAQLPRFREHHWIIRTRTWCNIRSQCRIIIWLRMKSSETTYNRQQGGMIHTLYMYTHIYTYKHIYTYTHSNRCSLLLRTLATEFSKSAASSPSSGSSLLQLWQSINTLGHGE